MRNIFCFLLIIFSSVSGDVPAKELGRFENNNTSEQLRLNLSLSPLLPLKVGKTSTIIATLTEVATKKPLTFEDLQEVHTKKLHLLIVDPSLTDYHHIHPNSGQKPGEYIFQFTPRKKGSYRVWADLTPIATNRQMYVFSDIGMPLAQKVMINRSISMTSSVEGYDFTLIIEGEPKADEAVMGSILVKKDGELVYDLEPVMGAFAHIVGFGEDYHSIMHSPYGERA